ETTVVAHAFSQEFFTRMAERRVPQIVRKRYRFGKILVEAQCASNRAADRSNFDGMRQARPQMIPCAIQKNLGLVLHSTKCARMDDPRTVTLEFCAIRVARLCILTSPR